MKNPDMTCYRFHNKHEGNWLELSGCHCAKGCTVCETVCLDSLSDQGQQSLARQQERILSSACPPFFSSNEILIFTACLTLQHTSQEIWTARLVHWASKTHIHAHSFSLLLSPLSSLFLPLHSQPHTETAMKTQRSTKPQQRYC